jgi:hypothetical protein
VRAGSFFAGSTAHSGHTLIVNPGCLVDGCIAWVDWSRATGEEVEFVNLRELETRVVAAQEHLE